MTTVRTKLTLLYGGLVLASGTGLLIVTYLLVRSTGMVFIRQSTDGRVQLPSAVNPAKSHQEVVNQLLLQSGIALAIMAVLSVGVGWLVAGRVLRPLRTITAAAQQLSANDLHQRLALTGPQDELRQLADTFDALLGRLEAAFAAQRQFVANASHELRTPLARQRTLLDVALADPAPTVPGLRMTCQRALVAGQQQERLIEALLTLARSQRGLDHREPVELSTVAADVVEGHRAEAQHLRLNTDLDPAPVFGDPRLAERLIGNLLDNAVRHNRADGEIWIRTGTYDGRSVLAIANTGPVIPPVELGRLFAPFQRLGADRVGKRDSPGLGLSIVDAIVRAHDGWLVAQARPEGGLDVEIQFPARVGSVAARPVRSPVPA
ncbi:MAG TPA: HAMP domain-containing sensor histidine kinase [Mycobacteriales bacterium]|nr:HAMP domain-containing sensor histidine kinase [Mycobacteriales bacterium]